MGGGHANDDERFKKREYFVNDILRADDEFFFLLGWGGGVQLNEKKTYVIF